MSFLPSEGAISDCFQPFPLGHLWTFKKKTALRGNAYLKKNAGWTSFGLIMFPTVSDRFRLFPTVSDRFIFSNDFLDHFHLWKADPVQTRANHDA